MQRLRHLGENRGGDLRRRAGADVESHGPVKPLEAVGIETGGGQSLQAFGVGAATAEAADVEGIGTQRGRQRRVIQLRIVAQGHQRATRVQILAGQRVVGPVAEYPKSVKALWRSKGAWRSRREPRVWRGSGTH